MSEGSNVTGETHVLTECDTEWVSCECGKLCKQLLQLITAHVETWSQSLLWQRGHAVIVVVIVNCTCGIQKNRLIGWSRCCEMQV